MEKNSRLCKFSSDYFQGFTVDIDISIIESTSEIVATAISVLHAVLLQNNFERLLKHLDHTQFHIHDITLDDIKNNPDKIIWICDHHLDDDDDDEDYEDTKK